jgi:hypothetical protein
MASMASAAPARKVWVGGLAGATTAILVYVVHAVGGPEIPGEISAAITTVLTFVASYLVPPAESDQVVA